MLFSSFFFLFFFVVVYFYLCVCVCVCVCVYVCVFCRTCFSRATYACKFPSVRPSVCPSVQSTFSQGFLWAQILLQFFTDHFWKVACVFFMVWGCACGLDYFLLLFAHCELSHFSPLIYRQWYRLWAQLLLQCFIGCSETLHVFFFMA